MTADTFSILLCGIGGQGVLTISRIIASAAYMQTAFVCRTEARGLSQRGGSVSAEIRFGSQQVAPSIGSGGADLIIALDALEAARQLPYLRRGGNLISSDDLTVPAYLRTTPLDSSEGTENILRILQMDARARLLSMGEIALSSNRNIALLGASSWFLPLSVELLRSTVEQAFNTTNLIPNLNAFDAGRKLFSPTALAIEEPRMIPERIYNASA